MSKKITKQDLLKDLVKLNKIMAPMLHEIEEPEDDDGVQVTCPFCADYEVYQIHYVNCSNTASNITFFGGHGGERKFRAAIKLWHRCWMNLEKILGLLAKRKGDNRAQAIYLAIKAAVDNLTEKDPILAPNGHPLIDLKTADEVSGITTVTCPYHENTETLYPEEAAKLTNGGLCVDFSGIGNTFGKNDAIWRAFQANLPAIIDILS